MLPYIFLLAIVMLWVVLEEITIRRRSCIFLIIALVIFSAIRYYTVGTDTPTYTSLFRYHVDPAYLTYDLRVELGYQFLLHQLLKITNDYYIFFIAVTFLATAPIVYTLRKLSSNYSLSIFIYLTFGFYLNIFNPERQSIAMGIFFFSLTYLVNKDFKKYLLCILLASTFHISAWLMLPMYFLCHYKMKDTYKIITCFTVSYLGSSILISYLAQNNDRYLQYTETNLEGPQGRVTLLFYVILAVLVYIYGIIYRSHDEITKQCRILFMCGVAGLIPIAMLSTDPSGPQRILGYFSYGLMLIIPVMLARMKLPLINILFAMGAIAYFLLTVRYLGGIYPYKINPIFNIL